MIYFHLKYIYLSFYQIPSSAGHNLLHNTHKTYLQLAGSLGDRNLRHHNAKHHKAINNKNWNHSEEKVEPVQISSTYTFGSPGTMVIVFGNADITVGAVVGCAQDDEVASFALFCLVFGVGIGDVLGCRGCLGC